MKKILASIVVILLVAALSFSIYAAMTHESKSSNTDSDKDNQKTEEKHKKKTNLIKTVINIMEIITLTKVKKMRNQNQHLAHITETLISINPTTQLSNLAIINIKTINNKPTQMKLKINHLRTTTNQTRKITRAIITTITIHNKMVRTLHNHQHQRNLITSNLALKTLKTNQVINKIITTALKINTSNKKTFMHPFVCINVFIRISGISYHHQQ